MGLFKFIFELGILGFLLFPFILIGGVMWLMWKGVIYLVSSIIEFALNYYKNE